MFVSPLGELPVYDSTVCCGLQWEIRDQGPGTWGKGQGTRGQGLGIEGRSAGQGSAFCTSPFGPFAYFTRSRPPALAPPLGELSPEATEGVRSANRQFGPVPDAFPQSVKNRTRSLRFSLQTAAQSVIIQTSSKKELCFLKTKNRTTEIAA